MKKLTTLIMILFVSLTTLSQSASVFDEVLDTSKDLIGLSNLADIDSIKDLFVHYTKEVVEGSKDVVSTSITIVEDAVTMLVKESTIIVRQFIIFTSISFAIPILFGLFLLWVGFSKVSKYFITPKDIAILSNKIRDEEEIEYKKGKAYILYMNNYFRNKLTLIGFKTTQLSIYALATLLIVENIMPFIKVTFFSKLYLVELLTQYI